MPNPKTTYHPKRNSTKVYPAPSIPPPLPKNPGFLSTIIDGFAFGAGSSIGHRAVDSVFGSSKPTTIDQPLHPQSLPYSPCKEDFNKFIICVTDNETAFCNDLHKKYNECMSKTKADQKI
jgi:hypothetical protein